MKTLFSIVLLFAVLRAPLASAAAVPDCYRAKNVVRGQFLVLLTEGLSPAGRVSVSMALDELDLRVVDAIDTNTLLVDRAALARRTREEELATLAGLAGLVGKGVEAIGCNGLSRTY